MSSRPPGLSIPDPASAPKHSVLRDVCKSLAAMEQYLQSGCVKDEESSFEYKDTDGNVQGPFNAAQLAEWNEAVSFIHTQRQLKRYQNDRMNCC